MPRSVLLRTLAIAAGGLAAVAPHADAKTRFQRIQGYKAKGTPAKYDRVGILKIGDPKADNVLVLNPGTSASAAYFAPLARSIVARSPKWQVWSVERRENLLEDQSVLTRAKEGKATPKEVFEYYLGYLTPGTSVTTHFQSIPNASVAYAKRWGMNTEIHDLRNVVLKAEALGGKVIVGGHSLGGTITTAYATWDFGGKPGAKGLSGLVFIDGASRPVTLTAASARTTLDAFNAPDVSPWLTFGGFPAPLAGLFNSTGALSVELDPDSPSVGQASGLLPTNITPPVPATNAGQYGYALDTATSPTTLAAAQAHLGHLASGSPAGWDDAGELTPIARMAEAFSGYSLKSLGGGLDGTAWYHPQRLTTDAGAVNQGNANPAQAVLDVKTTHGDDLPKSLRMYSFDAALGGGRVKTATRQLAKQSGIPLKRVTSIDRHTTYAHNDPNTAAPGKDAFLKHLTPFLRAVLKG